MTRLCYAVASSVDRAPASAGIFGGQSVITPPRFALSDLTPSSVPQDTLNAKAALFAIESYYEEVEKATGSPVTRLPLMISGTIVDMSGRTLS